MSHVRGPYGNRTRTVRIDNPTLLPFNQRTKYGCHPDTKKLGADFSIIHSNVIVFTLDTPGPRGKMITLISMACKGGAAENRTLVGRM